MGRKVAGGQGLGRTLNSVVQPDVEEVAEDVREGVHGFRGQVMHIKLLVVEGWAGKLPGARALPFPFRTEAGRGTDGGTEEGG